MKQLTSRPLALKRIDELEHIVHAGDCSMQTMARIAEELALRRHPRAVQLLKLVHGKYGNALQAQAPDGADGIEAQGGADMQPVVEVPECVQPKDDCTQAVPGESLGSQQAGQSESSAHYQRGDEAEGIESPRHTFRFDPALYDLLGRGFSDNLILNLESERRACVEALNPANSDAFWQVPVGAPNPLMSDKDYQGVLEHDEDADQVHAINAEFARIVDEVRHSSRHPRTRPASDES